MYRAANGGASNISLPRPSYLVRYASGPWPAFSDWPRRKPKSITFRKITPRNPLRLWSQMPENGVIFSDGIEADFLQFTAGTLATVGVAPKKGHLVL